MHVVHNRGLCANVCISHVDTNRVHVFSFMFSHKHWYVTVHESTRSHVTVVTVNKPENEKIAWCDIPMTEKCKNNSLLLGMTCCVQFLLMFLQELWHRIFLRTLWDTPQKLEITPERLEKCKHVISQLKELSFYQCNCRLSLFTIKTPSTMNQHLTIYICSSLTVFK